MSAVFFVDKKIRKIYAKNTFKIIKLLIVMSSYYISNRKVANFARSLAVKDWFWDNSFMLWLRKEVLELSQVEASKYVASCDSSELTDFDELDLKAAQFFAPEIEKLCLKYQEIQLAKDVPYLLETVEELNRMMER